IFQKSATLRLSSHSCPFAGLQESSKTRPEKLAGGARWRLRAVAGGGRKKAAPGGAAEVEWPGGGRSGCGGFVGGDLVGTEGDDLLAGKLVELRDLLLQRHELVGDEHARGFLDVAEAGGILRDDTHELGRDAVPCELVVAGDALDVVEVVFGGDFG